MLTLLQMKSMILLKISGLNKNDVSAVINDDLGENEKEIIAGLEEFDFDDI